MNRRPITIKDIKRHITYCIAHGVRYDWLGFVENKDLTPGVEVLFSVGNNLWDWVKGNDKLRTIERFMEKQEYRPAPRRREEIREIVERALGYQLDMYGVREMARDSSLSEKESQWAEDHIGFRAIIKE